MKCCQYCFEDIYLITKISEYDTLGNCDYCGSEEGYIIDIDDLTKDIEKVFQYYESTEPYEYFYPEIHDDPSEFGDRLIDLINEDWSIFSEKIVGTGTDEKLLFDILNFNKINDTEEYIAPYNLYSRITEAFNFIHPLEDWEQIWDDFKWKIKHSNRFFHEFIDETFKDRIDEILENRTVCTNELDLFRARLGEHSIDQMMAPPSEHATAGRANPSGISYLYCAKDEPTCIAEIRPWKGAKVTVARVVPKKELKLVRLFSIPISPFSFESPYTILEIDKILSSFIQELSTPVNPNKSEIEYLPTQYITELIKTKGFDGIEFGSAMGPGNNIVIFDESNVDVKSHKIIKVNNITYNYN